MEICNLNQEELNSEIKQIGKMQSMRNEEKRKDIIENAEKIGISKIWFGEEYNGFVDVFWVLNDKKDGLYGDCEDGGLDYACGYFKAKAEMTA